MVDIDNLDVWNHVVNAITKKTFCATVPYEPNLGQRQHIDKHIIAWKIALIWALKIETEEKKRLKLPYPFKVVKLLKPRGLHLHCIYVLCEKCHAWQKFLGYKLPYNDAFQWLSLIYQELIYEGVTEVFYPEDSSFSTRKSLLRNGEIKRHRLREKNDRCSLVANYINPFRENSGLHNLSILLDASIQLAQKYESFKNRCFTPYIDSWRDMLASEGSSEFKLHWVKNGELYCQGSSGRHIRNLTKESRPRNPLRRKDYKNYQQLF